jgi:hypothetical protein
MFIIHGYQGLGNVHTLACGQVSSWLNCAEVRRTGIEDIADCTTMMC